MISDHRYTCGSRTFHLAGCPQGRGGLPVILQGSLSEEIAVRRTQGLDDYVSRNSSAFCACPAAGRSAVEHVGNVSPRGQPKSLPGPGRRRPGRARPVPARRSHARGNPAGRASGAIPMWRRSPITPRVVPDRKIEVDNGDPARGPSTTLRFTAAAGWDLAW